jgi:hypothetical protein
MLLNETMFASTYEDRQDVRGASTCMNIAGGDQAQDEDSLQLGVRPDVE